MAKLLIRRNRPAVLSAPLVLAVVLSMLVVAPMVASAFDLNVKDIHEQYEEQKAQEKANKQAAEDAEKKAEVIDKDANDAIELYYKVESKVPTHSYQV